MASSYGFRAHSISFYTNFNNATEAGQLLQDIAVAISVAV